MTSLVTQKQLLIIAGLLVAIKFVLLPLLAWQAEQISRLQAKSVQLHKVSEVLANQSTYTASMASLKAQMFEGAERFYVDNARTKLTIQTDIEEIFQRHQLAVEGFDWTVDSAEPLRVLRATVRFSGATESMIRSFWDLTQLPTWARQVESSQQLKDYGEKNLGGSKGLVTLEFYALGDDYFDPDRRAELPALGITIPAGGD